MLAIVVAEHLALVFRVPEHVPRSRRRLHLVGVVDEADRVEGEGDAVDLAVAHLAGDLGQVAEARQHFLLVRDLVEVEGRHQAGVDIALQLRRVDGEEVEVLAFAALDLGPDLVVGADEDDIDVGAALRLNSLTQSGSA